MPSTIMSVSHGASGRSWVVMTSSMITFCTSGIRAWMSCPQIATPNAMNAFFLCGFM